MWPGGTTSTPSGVTSTNSPKNTAILRTVFMIVFLFSFGSIPASLLRFFRLLDHLVSSNQYLLWNREADLLGGFQIDYKLELCLLLDGNVGGLSAFQNLINECSGAAERTKFVC